MHYVSCQLLIFRPTQSKFSLIQIKTSCDSDFHFSTILSVFVGFLVTCSVCEWLNSRLSAGEYRHSALRVLSQFSFQRSASAIFNTEIREGTLPAIHGIRFLSIAWIVLGHEYVVQVFAANINLLDFVDVSMFMSLNFLFLGFVV